ncbi:hypothetical protein BO71DRAFT_428066 [Aspergillus ellipticus CBS 707.79]|uniref:Uncharacterized protein n=1 Tax=Aspergillus ellipticus CBS 707.79 TaxID=1448320 RepID=A0A319DGM3_9EURO|nr:hypothetical protein BO71DRAFT_428066 [Aspergillus ellipticus CBS 707.79]
MVDVQVARSLDEAGVPSVFMLDGQLSAYGIDIVRMTSAWVIADELIERACEALRSADFCVCEKGEDCGGMKPNLDFEDFAPAYHFHFPLRKDFFPEGNEWTETLELYRKSDVLPNLPDPELGPPTPDDPNYMLVSDPSLPVDEIGIGGGRWPVGAYPIKIPRVPRFIEAMFQVILRHNPDNHPMWSQWGMGLSSIAGYSDYCLERQKVNILTPNWDDVNPPARRFIELLSGGGELKDCIKYLSEVRGEMVERGERPQSS